MKVEVLDHGHVQYVSHMGDDLSVVNAARVSFNKESKEMTDKDAKLISYLATHNHWTPFAHCVATVRIKMPIFVARQWMKSTVGIAYNEVSRRYVSDEPQFYTPKIFRGKAENKKQGSSDEAVPYNENEIVRYREACSDARNTYQDLLDNGVAEELARMILPVSLYTEVWMTGSLAAMARVYSLRSDSHAQWETQQYAGALGKIVQSLYPVSWAVLTGGKDGREATHQ